MRSMFRPIKKIFTYIQKNASNGTMFGNASTLKVEEQQQEQAQEVQELQGTTPSPPPQHAQEEDDIERQIKTSIIDASKVKAKLVLPLELQLDDELADFAEEPVNVVAAAAAEEEELDEQFLELENFPNNEIIVLETELNSSLASDNVSEDPLALEEVEEQQLESTGNLLWLETPQASTGTTTGQAQELKKSKELELRSDGGSDSGLGSENDRQAIKPLRSNLKRRLEDELPELSGVEPDVSVQKRAKRSINFDSVKVYYFPRQQGFSCVPTVGGCTLGMAARHIAFKTMTLAEHAAELRRAHRSQQQQQQEQQLGNSNSSDDSEESEEDYLSECSGSDADDGSNGFLQPVTPKQRRALLKAAGVRKIDANEKRDCRDIRNSREVCGCSCREFCDPETCACSQAGIKCQVDRAMFPCGCSREACGNTVGRVEFNPTRVRTHYIHTVMRLELEQRQSQGAPNLVYASSSSNGNSLPAASSSSTAGSSSTSCYFMQPQSNYSSGYASPAYTPDSSVSYYHQQPQAPTAAVTATSVAGFAASYAPMDSLDSGLFASGSNATPSYGELLAPSFLHQPISQHYASTQLNAYSSYPTPTTPAVPGLGAATPTVQYSSCAVPSVPPFGNATTTASNATLYQQPHVLETTTAAGAATNISRISSSMSLSSSNCAVGLSRLVSVSTTNDFIIGGSSSRLSQITELLQHNRSTTAALVAVSEGYTVHNNNNNNNNSSSSSTQDNSIDTPPIVEEAQRNSCLGFEELPPPPLPIVAVHNAPNKQQPLQLQSPPTPSTPTQSMGVLTITARQPLDTNLGNGG
ncbi:Axud1 [Drosophila busckii]|uniref:Axud1 n=1 Tax=Drosophila busckii TaxID=30019 RepID=A0A0M4EH25_DROBS|nr:uncharacterized protein LOC108607199 [Drosophila busckii]XP_017853364.1 uncharacterized protein LOC108607199 [Drosophila busckii]ALC40155.1 Axud1 [Drosophila busckii]